MTIQINDIFSRIKDLLFTLKSEPEVAGELRKLVLGLITCATILYTGASLLLEPQEKEIKKKQIQKSETENSAPTQLGNMLSEQLAGLTREKKELDEETAALALQVAVLKEHWQGGTDNEPFTRTLFSLRTNAPVSLEKGLHKMSRLDDRTENGYVISTVNLAGELSFTDLYRYLQYLENRPELNILENLAIARQKDSGNDQNVKVQFSVIAGRTALEEL